jgi:hypothetical protein
MYSSDCVSLQNFIKIKDGLSVAVLIWHGLSQEFYLTYTDFVGQSSFMEASYFRHSGNIWRLLCVV